MAHSKALNQMENSKTTNQMKKIFLVPFLFLMSCSAVDSIPTIAEHQLFHANIESVESRTYLTEDILLRWTADDRITIFEGTTRNKQYKFLGETGDNAGDFDYVKAGFGTGNEVDRHYAIYPYNSATKLSESGVITYTFPAQQSYAVGSVGLGANVMVAATQSVEDYDLTFRNVGSYLLVKLYGTDQTVESIAITAKGGEALAGKAYITPAYRDVPTTEMVGTTSTVTLKSESGVTIGKTADTATAFWIVLPPFTASQGISVTVKGYYGGTQTYDVEGEIVFNRNKYKTLTRELTLPSNGTGMGVGGWGDGENVEGEI